MITTSNSRRHLLNSAPSSESRGILAQLGTGAVVRPAQEPYRTASVDSERAANAEDPCGNGAAVTDVPCT